MSGGGSRLGRGAHNRTRTDDLFLTKEVLCQLSYVGPGPIARLLVGREGIEPPQPKAAGLQPAELTTCSTYPLWRRPLRETAVSGTPATGSIRSGGDDGTRTRNLLFTKQLLYQLSYVGATRRVLPQMTPSAPGNDRAARSDGSSAGSAGLPRLGSLDLCRRLADRGFARQQVGRGGVRCGSFGSRGGEDGLIGSVRDPSVMGLGRL